MSIASLTTNIEKQGINLLSGLANNSESLMPMLVKDTMSNFAIVDTYKKNGGKDDARERAIEEFGTGAIWLLAIPNLKKLIDKTVYPLLKLDSNFDTRLILDNAKEYKKPTSFIGKLFYDGINKEAYKNIQNQVLSSDSPVYLHEKEVLKSLQNSKTSKLYKNAFFAKFAIATVASALGLVGIIKYKQKTTKKRIEKDYYKNNASKILLAKKLNNNVLYQAFMGKKKSKNISFKGLDAFMTNPILNTLLLDGVITTTRLKEARKGEKFEVGLKEFFQIVFIYGLAKPIQTAFEKIGKKLNLPIELDPKVLFDKKIKDKLPKVIEEIENLSVASDKRSLTQKIFELGKEKPDSVLINILDKNGVVPTIKDKNGEILGVSVLKGINENKLQASLTDIKSLSSKTDNLSKIKGLKVATVILNVLIAAGVMGIVQPLINIAFRKLFHNGDVRNHAIAQIEKEMDEKSNFNK